MSIWLYHYTDAKATSSIKNSKLICQSTDTIKDAVWGQGTYFTDMDPNNHTAEQIAFNNWRRRNLTTVIQQKIQYCIKVKFTPGEIESCTDDGRRIFLYRGNVDLSRHQFEIIECNFSTDSGGSGAVALGGVLLGVGAVVLLGIGITAACSRN